MPAFWDYPHRTMITHTIDSHRIHFIPSQKYIVWGYNYKSMNLTKPETYVKGYTNYHIWVKFERSSIRN